MEKTTLYNRKTTSSTNLWSANLNEVSKETDLSRASWFYSYDLQQFVEYGEKEGQSSIDGLLNKLFEFRGWT